MQAGLHDGCRDDKVRIVSLPDCSGRDEATASNRKGLFFQDRIDGLELFLLCAGKQDVAEGIEDAAARREEKASKSALAWQVIRSGPYSAAKEVGKEGQAMKDQA